MKYKRNTKRAHVPETKTRRYEKIFIILSLIFFAVYPFIARVTVLAVTADEEYRFSTTNGRICDIALYPKEIAIAAFAAVAILFFAAEMIFPDHPEHLDINRFKNIRLPFIFMLGMLLFASLSFAFSKNREVAFWGVHTEYEGYLALISYLAVCLFGIYYMRKDDAIELLKGFVTIISIVAGALCCVELLWKPILEFRLVQHLISSKELRELAESIRSLYFTGQSSLMFNNPGFLGGFAALMIPIDVALYAEAKGLPRKCLHLAALVLMCVAMYGSHSRAAEASLIVSIPIALIPSIRKLKKEAGSMLLPAVIAMVLCIVTVAGMAAAVRAKNGTQEASGPAAKAERLFKLDKAQLERGMLFFTSGDDTLVCSVDRKKLEEYLSKDTDEKAFVDCISFMDYAGNALGTQYSRFDNNRVDLHLEGVAPADPRFDMITVATEGRMVYFCFGYDGPAQFAMTETGFRSFIQGEKLEDSIPQPKVTGLERFYSFGTGRGYIWIQSLPVMKECLLIGKGCGNFAFNFVQNEMVGLLNTNGSTKYVIDRPHNWYIQSFVSNGLPYVLCMLALFVFVLLRFIVMAKRKELEHFDAGLFGACLGFMITGIINDSCVTVNPIFWLLFGVAVIRTAGASVRKKAQNAA